MKLRALLVGLLCWTLAAAPALAGVSGYQPASASAPTTVTVNTPPNDLTTGPSTCTSTGTCTALTVASTGAGSVGITVAGSGTGMAFTFQGAVDATTPTYFTITCYAPGGTTSTGVTTGSANGSWYCPAAGYKSIRLNWTGLTGGTVTETLNSSAGSAQPASNVSLNAPANDVQTGPTACTTTTCLNALTVSTKGSGSMGVAITGSGAGMSFTFEGSVDGSNFVAIQCAAPGSPTGLVSTGSANGVWACPVSGMQIGKVVWSALTSGTATETLNASAGSSGSISTTTISGKNGSTNTPLAVNVNGDVATVVAPSSLTSDSIVANVAGSSSSSLVGKASAGNLYSAYVTTGATQGWLMIFNATSAPSNGATTAGTASGNMQDCVYAPANATTVIYYAPGPMETFSVGITSMFSSTGCGTLTASATAFLHSSVQ